MALIVKADVLAVASQLSTVADATWALVLAFVNAFPNPSDDPTLRKLALCFFAAHLATLMGPTGASGAAGPVISETAGGLKRTYAQPMSQASTADLNRTPYGQQFLAILKMSPSIRGPILI